MEDWGCGIARVDAVAGEKAFRPGTFCGQRSRSKTRTLAVGVLIILITLCAGSAIAQDQPAPPTPPPQPAEPTQQTPPPAQETPQQPANPIAAQAQKTAVKSAELFNLLDKKSIVFPDIASSTVALSPAEKFKLFVDNTISVHTALWAVTGSAFGQAADSPTGFNQGFGGYGKRVGSSMARQASGQFFGTFLLSSTLHEDPRFFPQYDPTFKGALKYSLKRLFITRNDAGLDVANKQELLGPLLGEGLANLYWPERNRTVGDTLFRYGIDMGVRAWGNMFRDYWPVVFAKIRHSAPQPGAPH